MSNSWTSHRTFTGLERLRGLSSALWAILIIGAIFSRRWFLEAYSKGFRARVLAARDAGASTHEVALRFKVSKAWVRRIVQQRRETGQLAAE